MESNQLPSMSPEINELALALMKAQTKYVASKRETEGYGYKYSELSDCIEATRPALTENGLSISQIFTLSPSGKNILSTFLLHESGQWIKSDMYIKPAKDDPQGHGSAQTYARRYSYNAIVGLAQEDDDGAASMPDNKSTASSKTHKRTASKPTPNSNGAEDLGSWVFPKGKFENRPLKEIPINELDSLATYYIEKGITKGYCGEFLKILPKYKASLIPNATTKDSGPTFDSSEEIPW